MRRGLLQKMDKDNVHINSEFVDRSWQEMSKLLDQEMPVKKHKRRLIWLWFFGLGLLLLGGLVYYNQPTPRAIKAMPIPENPAIASTNSNKLKTPSTFKINPLNTNNKKVPKKQAPRKSSDEHQAFQPIINLTETIPAAVTNNAAVGNSVGKSTRSDGSIPNLTSNLGKTENSNPRQLNKKIVVADLAILPNLPFALLSSKKRETNIPLFPTKIYPNWRFGIYAGLLVPQSGSFRAGLHANILFKPRWTLQFGLGYSKRIPKVINLSNSNPNTNLGAAPIEAEMDDMSTTVGANPAPTNNPTGTDPTGIEAIATGGFRYTNFHYFELPILVQYTIRPKFSVEFGGNLSYLYGYNYQYNEGTFFTSSTNFDIFTTTRSTTFNQADIGTINKLEIAIIGGVNYQITNKINGYANFHYSSPYLKGTPTSSFSSKNWQQIEVGIRYYFK